MTTDNVGDGQDGDPDTRGAWIAYYSDYSGMVLFADELSALRHAVENTMGVKFVRHGEDIR